MVLILLFQIQGRDAVHEWPLEEVQYVLQTSGTQETRGSWNEWVMNLLITEINQDIDLAGRLCVCFTVLLVWNTETFSVISCHLLCSTTIKM